MHPFVALDEKLAVIVNEPSAPLQGSGSSRTGGDGHHAGILDRTMHVGFVVHELGNRIR